jgi:hypothetical protein
VTVSVFVLMSACGESTDPNGQDSVPSAPTDLQVVAISPTSARLDWQDRATNESGFRIYRGGSAESATALVGTVAPDVETWNDTGLAAGTTYFYRLYAYNAAGESAAYAAGSVLTPATTPPVSDAGPDQAVATGVTVTLDGTGSSDADGDALSYSWTQVGGTTVTLSDPTAAQPSFAAPHFLETFAFALTVSDAQASGAPDTVQVVVDHFTQITLAADVTPANSDTETPGKFALGFDGTNFLLVSCRHGGGPGPSGVFAAVVSTAGVVATPVSISAHDCAFPRPALAFDGTAYVAVFQRNGEIVAARLLPSGTTLSVTSEIVVSAGNSNWAPAIAFDGSAYLAAWSTYDAVNGHDIHGARISGDGQSLGEFTIFSEVGEQVESAVTFDGTNFLVVWRDTRSGSGPAADTDIYGTRVSPGGTVLDAGGIAICTADNIQGEPQAVSDGTNSLVVWNDARNHPPGSQPPLDVYATRVSSVGALLDGSASSGGIAINTVDVTPELKFYPWAGFDGTDYIVPFAVTGFSAPAGIYYARVSTGGVLLDGSPGTLGPSVSGVPPTASRFVYPAMISGSEISLLAWVDNTELSGSAKKIVGTLVARF